MANDANKYTSSRSWIITGYLLLIIFIGGSITWAATSSISGAVIAQGVIGIEGKVKTIQHLDGGILQEIHVADGDLVQAGDLLIRLVDTDIRANLAIITDSYFDTIAQIARLKSERDGTEAIVFPETLLNAQEQPRVAQAIAGQILQFKTRASNVEIRKQVMEQKIVQLNEQIVGLQAQRAAIGTQRDLVTKDIEIKSPAAEQGIIAGNVMIALEQRHAQLTGEFEQSRSTIAQARGAIEEIKLQILQLEIDFQDSLLADLEGAETRLAEMQERKIAAEDRLFRIDIRAPTNGRIHDLSIHTIGGVISPARPIMQIIPDEEKLLIEARVATTDIDSIKIGQEGAVHLSAFSSRNTPVLIGYVTNRSAAQLVDDVTGLSYYSVEIEISEQEIARLEEGQILIPGMPAEVFVQTEERNALNYLLKPFLDIVDRAFLEE